MKPNNMIKNSKSENNFLIKTKLSQSAPNKALGYQCKKNQADPNVPQSNEY